MTVLHVRHRTVYRYREPVEFGEHRLMSRPRDSHDLRLIDTTLSIQPAPSQVRWIHDPFGNSIAIIGFDTPAAELVIESSFRAEHFPLSEQAFEVEPYARAVPFLYSPDDARDLKLLTERHYPDPDGAIDRWMRARIEEVPGAATMAVLRHVTESIRSQFTYGARELPGTQTPLETLALNSGSCRDLALFMMEAARSVGLAARFVSGYLYDSALVDASSGLVGGGATHAWLEIFIPGAGWIEFDPTNALVGGRNLIRVAVTRDPRQAIPLQGSFTGPPNSFVSMHVEVEVTTE
jgi:transglutaminase-like putative cysteine protease